MRRDVKELLPNERNSLEKSRDADEWAARQRERFWPNERKDTKERLKPAKDTEHL